MLIFKLFLIVVLTRLLVAIEKPLVCAAIYTVTLIGFAAMFTDSEKLSIVALAIGGVIIAGVSSLYFWLLDRFAEGGAYWAIFVIGFVVLLFL